MEGKKKVVGGVTLTIGVIAIIIIAFTVSFSEKSDPGMASGLSSFDKDYLTTCDPPSRNSPSESYKKAAVSSDAEPCAEIAKDILKRNGTAADAAIAGMFCVGIINAQSCGLGGGFFATYFSKKDNQVYTLDAREVAPKAAYPQMYDPNFNTNLKARKRKGKWYNLKKFANLKGGLAVAVPGEPLGLYELYKKFGGGLPWKDLLKPAIDICEKGYDLSWYTGGIMYPMRKDFHAEPSMSLFTTVSNDTEEPIRTRAKGEVVKRLQLAKTLRVLQEEPEALYKGSLAEGFVRDIKSFGGIITKEDLYEYKPIWRDPVKVHLKNGNFTLYSMPPPGAGLLVGLILNILDEYNLSGESLGKEEIFLTHHRIAESFKFAFAERHRLGDLTEDQAKLLLDELTNDKLATKIRNEIEDSTTFQDPLHYGTNIVLGEDDGTAHFSLVSPNGDAIAVTSSINMAFGAGVRSESTGIILNNEMADFTTSMAIAKEGNMNMSNNVIIPGNRPLSSMSPSIVLDSNSQVHLVFGAAGGIRIPTAAAIVAARNLWMGQSVKEAIDSCRSHHSLLPMKLTYEKGFSKAVLNSLETKGHVTSKYKWKSVVSAIGRDKEGNLNANYDYRKSGQISGF